MRRLTIAIAAVALVACGTKAPTTTGSTLRARAAQVAYDQCAAEVSQQHGIVGPPPLAPMTPSETRARAPREWARYDQELRRYRDEYQRYHMALRILQDKIAVRCSRQTRSQ